MRSLLSFAVVCRFAALMFAFALHVESWMFGRQEAKILLPNETVHLPDFMTSCKYPKLCAMIVPHTSC